MHDSRVSQSVFRHIGHQFFNREDITPDTHRITTTNGDRQRFFPLLSPSSLGLGEMICHFIARGPPRDVGNLSVEHFAKEIVTAEFLLFSPQYQFTLETKLGSYRGGRAAMIALQGTRSHQYGAFGIECLRCKELELSHLVARQKRAGKVIPLTPDAAALPPSIRRPAKQVKR